MVDGIGTTSYTYKAAGTNGAGQIASVDGPLSNDTIAYSYDELGRVIQRTINGTANQVDWTFDSLGRVTSEENLLGEFTYTYDGVTNRLATVTYPNGQTSAYSYLDDEHDLRLETIHHKYPNTSTLSKFDYTYDAVGNILTWRQQADSTAVLWKYGYDQADQLISAVKHATDTPQTVLQRFAYAYDPAGNRTVEQIDDAITLSAYDNLNRLTSQAPGGPMIVAGSLNEPGTVTISGVPAIVDASNNFRGTVPTTSGTNAFTIVAKDATGNTTTQQYEVELTGASRTFTYDANGNLNNLGSDVLSWDARDRLVGTTGSDGASTQIDVGGNGLRARTRALLKGTTVSEVALIWCGVEVCESRPLSGVPASEKPFPQGVLTDSTPTYHVTDASGSVFATTDTNAAVETTNEYDPWGRPQTVPSLFAGYATYAHQPIGNLWLAPWRVYSPDLGRWLSEDPIRDGPNVYEFVRNSPTVLIDIDGLQTIPDGIRQLWGPVTKPLRIIKFLRCGYQNERCLKEVKRQCRTNWGEPNGPLGPFNDCDWCIQRNRQCCSDQLVRCMSELPVKDPREEIQCTPQPTLGRPGR